MKVFRKTLPANPIILGTTLGLRACGILGRSVPSLVQGFMDLSLRTSNFVSADTIRQAAPLPKLGPDDTYVVVPEVTLETPAATFAFAKEMISFSLLRKGWGLIDLISDCDLEFNFPHIDKFEGNKIKWKAVDLVGQSLSRTEAGNVADAVEDINTPVFAALYAMAVHDYLPAVGQNIGGGFIQPPLIPAIKVIKKMKDTEVQGFMTMEVNHGAKKVILDYAPMNTARFRDFSVPVVAIVRSAPRQQQKSNLLPFQTIGSDAVEAVA